MPQSNLSIVPVRATASDKAEMVTQLLYGEEYTVLEKVEKWVKIKLTDDQYVGWICAKQFNEETFLTSKKVFSKDPILPLMNENGNLNILSFGSYISEKVKSTFSSNYSRVINENESELVFYANLFVNTPYLWGGKSIFGVDCSGFIQLAFKAIGVKLPRDAYQQAKIGELVEFKNLKVEDVAFFESNGRICLLYTSPSPRDA